MSVHLPSAPGRPRTIIIIAIIQTLITIMIIVVIIVIHILIIIQKVRAWKIRYNVPISESPGKSASRHACACCCLAA